MRTYARAIALACLALPTAHAASTFGGTDRFDLDRDDIRRFVESAAKTEGIAPDDLYHLLAKAEPQPKIIAAMQRPAEKVSPWWEYRKRFLTAQRIREGVAFWQQHRELLDRVAGERGVAPEYIVAILGVETYYGRLTGRYRVLDALATLAFDYPPRAGFFGRELASFLLLSREESVDPLAALGSYAGAMGAPQFMPSSYRRYAVDGDGDGRRDLFTTWDDVVASVANYFREHGWQPGGPVLIEAQLAPDASLALDPANLALTDTLDSARAKGLSFDSTLPGDTAVILVPAEGEHAPGVRIGFANFITITRYNRSVRYAMAVHDLAQALVAATYSADE
ncbi:MAG: lytic murein transglycosylase B [Steroidobacteraceae bacterium]